MNISKRIIIMLFISLFSSIAYAQSGVDEKGYLYTYNSAYDFFCEDGVLFLKDVLVKYPQNKKASIYTIPDGIKIIAKGAFQGNKHITTIRIPSNIKFIGDNAFDSCDLLTSIEIYESASGVRPIEAEEPTSEAKEVGRYNIQGVKVQEGEDGQMQIILYSDGTAKKVTK